MKHNLEVKYGQLKKLTPVINQKNGQNKGYYFATFNSPQSVYLALRNNCFAEDTNNSFSVGVVRQYVDPNWIPPRLKSKVVTKRIYTTFLMGNNKNLRTIYTLHSDCVFFFDQCCLSAKINFDPKQLQDSSREVAFRKDQQVDTPPWLEESLLNRIPGLIINPSSTLLQLEKGGSYELQASDLIVALSVASGYVWIEVKDKNFLAVEGDVVLFKEVESVILHYWTSSFSFISSLKI